MTKNLDTKALDGLFLAIFGDLLKRITERSDEATEEILDLSSHLLSQDIQSLLEAFYKLSQAQNLETTKDDNPKQSALELATLQQELDILSNTNNQLKAQVSPIIAAFQFSELLHRHTSNIENAWTYAINELNKTTDCRAIAIEIEQRLNTQVERKAFNQQVLKREILIESIEDVDNLLDSNLMS